MWVLVVHISLNYGYIQYGVPSGRYNMFTLLSFYMFTFYFAAGYFFNNKRDFRELFIRKTRSLVVPWIIYTIFGILVYLMYCYVVNEDIKIDFYSIINSWALSTNTPMWFLGSLFFSTMATWFMINWSNRGGVFFIDDINACCINNDTKQTFPIWRRKHYIGYVNYEYWISI